MLVKTPVVIFQKSIDFDVTYPDAPPVPQCQVPSVKQESQSTVPYMEKKHELQSTVLYMEKNMNRQWDRLETFGLLQAELCNNFTFNETFHGQHMHFDSFKDPIQIKKK